MMQDCLAEHMMTRPCRLHHYACKYAQDNQAILCNAHSMAVLCVILHILLKKMRQDRTAQHEGVSWHGMRSQSANNVMPRSS